MKLWGPGLLLPASALLIALVLDTSAAQRLPSPPFCVTDKNPLEDQRYCQNGDTGGFRRILHDAIDDIKENVGDAIDDIKENVGDAIDAAGDKVQDIVEDASEAVKGFVQRRKIALDRAEDWLEDAWTRTRFVRRCALKGLLGTVMMGRGDHFGRCVVVAHTIRVTGWPIFKRAATEIAESWRNTRHAVRTELKDVRSPAELLSAVRFELQSARKLMVTAQANLDDGVLDAEEQRETIRKARVDVNRLTREAWVLNQAVDSFAAITAALDFPKLRDVLKSVYTGALACLASANSATVGKLSIAFDLASILSSDLHGVMESVMASYHHKEVAQLLPTETRRFFSAGISIASAIEGAVLIYFVVPTMSLRLSSAALGAAWVTDAIADVVDPFLEKRGWEPIEGHAAYLPIHALLTWGGYYLQTKYAGKGVLPPLIDRMLTPLTLAENSLKKMDKLFKKL